MVSFDLNETSLIRLCSVLSRFGLLLVLLIWSSGDLYRPIDIATLPSTTITDIMTATVKLKIMIKTTKFMTTRCRNSEIWRIVNLLYSNHNIWTRSHSITFLSYNLKAEGYFRVNSMLWFITYERAQRIKIGMRTLVRRCPKRKWGVLRLTLKFFGIKPWSLKIWHLSIFIHPDLVMI